MAVALSKGGNINSGGAKGRTALHRAAHVGNLEVVLFLLKHGACEVQDLNGDTPAHSAAKTGHAAVMKVLLERGSDPFIRNVSLREGERVHACSQQPRARPSGPPATLRRLGPGVMPRLCPRSVEAGVPSTRPCATATLPP